MRLLPSPPGMPFLPSDAPVTFEARAAFGPGHRYWTMSGRAIVRGGELLLVTPDENGDPATVVASAPVETVRVISKPWWSFGSSLRLEVGEGRFVVEPEPLYPGIATPGRIRRAREAARELETALTASP